jgi:hypothetical protein
MLKPLKTPSAIFPIVAVSAALLSAWGCAEKEEPAPRPTHKTNVRWTGMRIWHPPAAAPTSKSGAAGSPEAAAKAILDGLKNSKPVVVWNAMDSAAQSNLNRIVRETAAAMDQEVWDRSVRNLKKFATLVETKKDFILDNPLWKTSKEIKLADVRANWDPAARLLKTIAESELTDREKLKTFDGGKFLEGTGAKIYAELRAASKLMKNDPLKKIDATNVVVENATPTTAKVTFQAPGEKPIHLKLSLNDEKWTCVELTQLSAAATMYEREHDVQNLVGPGAASWKGPYLNDMDRIEQALDKLLAAKTSDEFQTVVAKDVFPFVMQKMAQYAKKPEAPKGAPAGKPVANGNGKAPSKSDNERKSAEAGR